MVPIVFRLKIRSPELMDVMNSFCGSLGEAVETDLVTNLAQNNNGLHTNFILEASGVTASHVPPLHTKASYFLLLYTEWNQDVLLPYTLHRGEPRRHTFHRFTQGGIQTSNIHAIEKSCTPLVVQMRLQYILVTNSNFIPIIDSRILSRKLSYIDFMLWERVS